MSTGSVVFSIRAHKQMSQKSLLEEDSSTRPRSHPRVFLSLEPRSRQRRRLFHNDEQARGSDAFDYQGSVSRP